MSIKNIWEDLVEYFRNGMLGGIDKELFQKELRNEESVDKLPTKQDDVKNENVQQKQQQEDSNQQQQQHQQHQEHQEQEPEQRIDEKPQEKNEIIDLSKGDDVIEESVIQVINNDNEEIDGNENGCKEKK